MKTPEQRLARAAQAEALMRNELFVDAFKVLEADYFKAWVGTTEVETQARENYWRAINMLGDVERHLKAVINDGKIAQAEINKLGGINRLAA